MITTANQEMIPSLKALWKEAFGDEDAYIDFFFTNKFQPDETFVYLQDGTPVSVAFVFDAELYIENDFMPIKYIYGVATAIKFRRQGLSTQILEHIKEIYPSTFLVPSTDNLFRFYRNNGYKNAFIMEHLQLEIEKMDCPVQYLEFQDITSEDYKAIRDEYFHGNGYIRWDKEMIDYALGENVLCGGSAIKIKTSNNNIPYGMVLYRSFQNQLFIKETTLSGQVLKDVAYLLMKQTNTTICHVRLKASNPEIGKPFGMLYHNGTLVNGYCNLVLD